MLDKGKELSQTTVIGLKGKSQEIGAKKEVQRLEKKRPKEGGKVLLNIATEDAGDDKKLSALA